MYVYVRMLFVLYLSTYSLHSTLTILHIHTHTIHKGMGEPLANYRNVMEAIDRIQSDLGIGARKITVSTVGLVPNIRKLMHDQPQVRLAVSLHCADEESRTKLMPANARYGGLDVLMTTLRDYVNHTKRRVTLEWALMEGQNDTPQVARQLGKLIRKYGIRKDMVHVNVIPLNPTGGFGGSPSGRRRVGVFVDTLEKEFGITCTPRMRRGIDIDAGCGQLKATIEKNKEKEMEMDMAEQERELSSFLPVSPDNVGLVYEDDDDDDYDDDNTVNETPIAQVDQSDDSDNGDIDLSVADFLIDESTQDLDDEDWQDTVWTEPAQQTELQRLIGLVQSSTPPPPTADAQKESTTTTIVDEEAVRDAKKRRKKLLKNLKAIRKLHEMAERGEILNEEQMEKIAKEDTWKAELESVEHNLQ